MRTVAAAGEIGLVWAASYVHPISTPAGADASDHDHRLLYQSHYNHSMFLACKVHGPWATSVDQAADGPTPAFTQ